MNPNIEKQKKGLLKLPLALANRNGHLGPLDGQIGLVDGHIGLLDGPLVPLDGE